MHQVHVHDQCDPASKAARQVSPVRQLKGSAHTHTRQQVGAICSEGQAGDGLGMPVHRGACCDGLGSQLLLDRGAHAVPEQDAACCVAQSQHIAVAPAALKHAGAWRVLPSTLHSAGLPRCVLQPCSWAGHGTRTHESAAHVRGLVCVRARGSCGKRSACQTSAVWRSTVASSWPEPEVCRRQVRRREGAGLMGKGARHPWTPPLAPCGHHDGSRGRAPQGAELPPPWRGRWWPPRPWPSRRRTGGQPAAGASGSSGRLRQARQEGVIEAASGGRPRLLHRPPSTHLCGCAPPRCPQGCPRPSAAPERPSRGPRASAGHPLRRCRAARHHLGAGTAP